MKHFIIILFFCFLGTFANAQSGGGIKAGVNLGTANISEAKNAWESEKGLTSGIHAGYFYHLSLGGIYIQPEIYYTFTQAKLRRQDLSPPQVPETYQLDFHRLDVPLMFGFRPLPLTRVNFGPFATVLIDTKAENSNPANQSMEEYADDLYNRANWGWQVGVGVDLWRFTLDARYETTVGDLRDQDFNNPNLPSMLPGEQSQRQIVFSLGFKL